VTAADDPTLGGLLGPEPKRAESCADKTTPVCGRCADCVPVDQYGGARWEIVDAHRCTACGHLDRDGYRMVEHLRTHGPLPNAVTVPGKTLADDAAEHDRGLTW
jgi:hypothetical protein